METKTMDIKTAINCPVAELGLSQAFNDQCRAMGFKQLKEVLALTPKELIATEGFSYNWLGELVTFLSTNQWLHFLQPVPGMEKVDVAAL